MINIRNTTASAILHYASGINFPASSTLSFTPVAAMALADDQTFQLISDGSLVANNGTTDFGPVEGWSYISAGVSQIEVTKQPEPFPFARATHRIKDNAIPSLILCEPNTQAQIDFYLSATRYVSGGEVIVEEWQFADWITAQVVDVYESIPIDERTARAEAWPVVSEYVPKKYLRPMHGYGYALLDTRPLHAEVPTGLVLRIIYNATTVGTTRKILVNYSMTMKLTT